MNESGQQMAANERAIVRDEKGQSIVLIALIIVGIVAFAGLAVDVGFLFARNSQFSAAVDAATLAGVVELHRPDGLNQAITRADQFLTTNDWPTDVITGSKSLTDLGIPQFTLTATWAVDTFFLGVLGFDDINITNSATAAFYARTDIPVTTAFDQGLIRTASQFIYGEASCSSLGDAASPKQATDNLPNPTYDRTEGVYTYRIAVPEEYINETGQSLVYVQLFDPDPHNSTTVDYSYTQFDGSAGTWTPNNGCTDTNFGETCVVDTGDVNPYWFVRVDEIYTSGLCPTQVFGSGNAAGTVTTFELYHLDEDQERHDLGVYESTNPSTDLKWVTPGVDVGAKSGTFVVDLNGLTLDEDDVFNIFMDVSSTGTSKNVWDVWAGPPEMANGYPDDVNLRNLAILSRTITTTNRSMVYALGYLPPNIYAASGDVELPIASFNPELGGGGVYVSAYDMDGVAGASTSNQLEFTLDTLSENDFKYLAAINCGGSCNFQWINPQVAMGIPTIAEGVAFYGGNLFVTYRPQQDDHTWSVVITRGRPFLTR